MAILSSRCKAGSRLREQAPIPVIDTLLSGLGTIIGPTRQGSEWLLLQIYCGGSGEIGEEERDWAISCFFEKPYAIVQPKAMPADRFCSVGITRYQAVPLLFSETAGRTFKEVAGNSGWCSIGVQGNPGMFLGGPCAAVSGSFGGDDPDCS